MTFYDPMRTLIGDWEVYPNLTCVGLRRVADGKTLVMEWSHRKQGDRDRLAALLKNNLIVGYNWDGFDAIISAAVVAGFSVEQVKDVCDRIILGGLKPWHIEEQLGITIPRSWKSCDLMGSQPNAHASLKTLAGRMHCPTMQDLPYSPDTILTDEEMDNVIAYMGNDLHVTHTLFDWLGEPLAIRSALSEEHGIPLLSKSDSQVGEAIVKRRVEEHLGKRVYKPEAVGGTKFRYNIPAFLAFKHPDLADVLERLRNAEFAVKADGKVDMPGWLSSKTVTIGETTYAMGIGGLHSTEKNRAVHSDEEHVLIDADCASYYPAIILNSGLYPKSLGPQFLKEFGKIRDDRVAAKRAGNKVKAEGAKIQINGQFGKLGSRYSVLYAPHLMIAVTLTGQLSLLMLIERAEAAGIPIVSGNTDGIVFRCPIDRRDDMDAICKQWEKDTAFELEYTEYVSLYNASVNSYIAVKPDGKAKIKGTLGNPWSANDTRGSLMKNPQATIVSDAVVAFITKGVPLEDTIRSGTDIRSYVTVVNVKGGGTWKGQYLGKVARFIYGHGGEEIYYKTPDPRTGNHKRVPKSDGAIPMMDLPTVFPADLIDYARYITEAKEALMDIGYDRRPDAIKPIRLYKWSSPLWFAIAAA